MQDTLPEILDVDLDLDLELSPLEDSHVVSSTEESHPSPGIKQEQPDDQGMGTKRRN